VDAHKQTSKLCSHKIARVKSVGRYHYTNIDLSWRSRLYYNYYDFDGVRGTVLLVLVMLACWVPKTCTSVPLLLVCKTQFELVDSKWNEASNYIKRPPTCVTNSHH